MNFDFSDEQKQLQAQLRKFLAARCPSSVVRAVLEGRSSFDRSVWSGLAEMGCLGAAVPEEYGGSGVGYLELCVIAEELGRALAPVPFCASIALATQLLLIAGNEEQKQRYLPAMARGELLGTCAFAESVGQVTPERIQARAHRGTLSGVKTAVPYADVADFAIVAARVADGDSVDSIALFMVDLEQHGVRREVVPTIDPTRSHARIEFAAAVAAPLGTARAGWPILMQALDYAAVLTAFEQLGGADRALEMARDYALGRVAFGRPIASFQAIKHMLADMYVAATLARSNCYYGAWALSTGASELPLAAATARVSATQAFQHCARNNIQVHGGMGFTWEFDCHLYYRRANALAVSLGSLSQWEDLLVERLPRQDVA